MIDKIANMPDGWTATLWNDLDNNELFLFVTNNIDPPKKYKLMDNGNFEFVSEMNNDGFPLTDL